MIERLLPLGFASAELFGDVGEAGLFEAERAAIATASPGRRGEFVAVRHCARSALARLGHPPVQILPGTSGAPHWPKGVIGSMTHREGYRAAAVARVSDQIWSVGIDAEPHQPLPEGVLDLVSLPSERAQCQALAPLVHWDRLLFCAKEAVYKAWFPLAGRWLGFEQCQIHLTRNTITAQLLIRGPIVRGTALQELQGNWLVADGLILAAVIVR